jgi:hypothetical protein
LFAALAVLIVPPVAGAGARPRPLDPRSQVVADLAAAPMVSLSPMATTAARAPLRRQRPRILARPHNVAVAAGRLAGFTAAASGVPTPRPQWQRSINKGRAWSNIRGAHGLKLTFTAKPTQSGTEYRAVFTNAAGRAITRAARLTVGPRTDLGQSTITRSGGAGGTSGSGSSGSGSSGGGTESTTGPISVITPATEIAPQVTTQPSNETAVIGNYVTFSAAASGTPTPSAQWERSSDGGQTWVPIPDANSTSLTFKSSSTQNADEYRAAFTNTAGTVTTNPATLVVEANSANWAGYIALGQRFSFVSGSWNVPAVTCTGSASTDSSQWVGIDGVEDPSVEQDGTESDCVGGVPTYSAWYAMWGDNEVNGGEVVQLSSSSYPVMPGDAITASVGLSGSVWTLVVSDITAGWRYSIDIPSPPQAPQQSSAEWVVERPVEGGALSALSNFATATFTGAAATDSGASGPISAFTDQPSNMVALTAPTPLATPGPLNPEGDGFTVTWNAGS